MGILRKLKDFSMPNGCQEGTNLTQRNKQIIAENGMMTANKNQTINCDYEMQRKGIESKKN